MLNVGGRNVVMLIDVALQYWHSYLRILPLVFESYGATPGSAISTGENL
jgi:hypothetical protein